MSQASSYIPRQQLEKFGVAVLEKLSVPRADAELLIDSLIQAELWGHESHGLLRLSWYYERLKNQAMRAVSAPQFVLDSGPLLVIDAQDSIGQVMAKLACQEAEKRARQHGIAAVGVRNSNHFGTAMYFTRMLAKQNLVAILTTNASPSMAPWGGRKKVIGNNPWSIAAPYKDKVVVLDMANTVVARGKIYAALEKDEKIPYDWAITQDGRRTNNPKEAVDGVILPMGGHKGYAISFMMDVLSGVLTGSEVATGVNGPYKPKSKSGAGHLLIAIDVEKFAEPESYNLKIEQLVGEVKGSPLAEGFDAIYYPGELEDKTEEANLALPGIKIYDSTMQELQKISVEIDIPL